MSKRDQNDKLRPVVFMFSGQGSQYYHMGKDLFEHNSVFRNWMFKLDSIANQVLKKSVLDYLYDSKKGKGDLFDSLVFSNPAIFMVEYALARSLMEEGITPDIVLGASLGEFTSAAISEIMTVEEALEAVVGLAKLFENSCQKGGMLAILHDPSLYHEIPLIHLNSELSAINCPSHFVVSGQTDPLKRIEKILNEKEILYQSLPVSYGFHSSMIDSSEIIFNGYFKRKSYQPATVPFISCASKGFLKKINSDHFWQVVRNPILFQKRIQALEKRKEYVYLDLGPSGTLATYVKYILSSDSNSIGLPILTPFGGCAKRFEEVKDFFSKQPFKVRSEKEKRMTTYVFPGQGSQIKGMGGTLFDEFKDLTSKADDILGYSIKDLCLEDTNGLLGRTQYTQPALYVVNVLMYLKRNEESGINPDYVVGHSLGEYNALFAAGAFDFETGLKLVKKRSELMAQATGGGMAAIIGLDENGIKKILRDNKLTNVDIANYNSPTQIVISGKREDINRAKPYFEIVDGVLFFQLNVSGAFHSRYMFEARNEFEKLINKYEFSELTVPVISNVVARPYRQENIKRNLVEQIVSPVKWSESIRYLMGKGEVEFEEVGPGNVLSGLIRRIKNESEPLIISDEEKIENQVVRHEPIEEKDKGAKINKVNLKTNTIKTLMIRPEALGNDEFKKDYNVKYAYVTGGMYHGIASKELVVKMGNSGMMGYFGTGGLEIGQIENSIQFIQKELGNRYAYGMNLLSSTLEDEIVDLVLKYNVKNIEAAAYLTMSRALVTYRLKGLSKGKEGGIHIENKVMAKVSRPEVAELFLSPAPERIVSKLLEEKRVTQGEAELSKQVPMADDLCVEADSGGHTDQGVAYALMPAMIKLRDEMMAKYRYAKKIRVGAAGGIGTPEAASAAFILGADFILTGSINQCTVEAGTSDSVKDLLQQMNVQDTEYAPAGDMFEMGAKVQVLKRGVFFPARANKLYGIYQHYNSLDEIDEKTKKQLQDKYFKRSFEDVYNDCKFIYPQEDIERAERNSKQKMALVFRWYLGHTTQLALKGIEEEKVDYQVHTGPALGAFNQWVKGTELMDWRNRYVNAIAKKLMEETASTLSERFNSLV